MTHSPDCDRGPRVVFRVTLMDSDEWSGQSSWTEDYATYEEAQARITSVNAKNTAPIAPSYYVQAKKKIEAVSVTTPVEGRTP